MAQATESIILDTRKKRISKLYPVRLRITYKRDSRYYTLEYVTIPEYEARRDRMPESLRFKPGQTITLDKDTYSKITGERPREPYSTVSMIFVKYKERARDIIDKIPNFSFDRFEQKYNSNKSTPNDAISMLTERATELREAGRISTAVTYDCTINSLKSFIKRDSLPFSKVSTQFLNKYEKWMISEGNGLTTVGIYLRNLRMIYRQAIKAGIIALDDYPFSKDDYQIPTGKNIKKALTLDQIGKIAAYDTPPGTKQQRYRDYWLFSYLCNGINVKDMALLKYSNIKGDVITFIRSKTAREKRKDPKVIQVVITKAVGRIIDRWGNKPAKPNEYIFPILKPLMTPQKEYDTIQEATKQINKYMKIISDELELDQKVTTYVARHSFATVLKRSGASTEFISESLGHSNLTTTENYLAAFEIEEKTKWANILLPEKD